MKRIINDFNRAEEYKSYDKKTNPFIIVTTKIDITNIYKLCQKKKHYYSTIGYYLTRAMNRVEEFKYFCSKGTFYKSDTLQPAFTDLRKDNTVGFYSCPLEDNLDDFLEKFDKTKNQFLDGTLIKEKNDDLGVWLTCQPWYHYNSLVPPFDIETINPQLVWDKFSFENDKCYINLTIIIHHGLVDGYHIGLLIDAINSEISNIQMN